MPSLLEHLLCALLVTADLILGRNINLYEEPEITLNDYYYATEAHDPYSVVYGLMSRILQSPFLVSQFELELIANSKKTPSNYKLSDIALDTFELDNNGTAVILRGSSIIALCSAFNYYLINWCNTTYDWKTYSIDLAIQELPLPSHESFKRSVPLSYHENICTLSYTQAFWNWTIWEKHIDWMAMQGINMPLALIGQEYIWMKTYMRSEFNLSITDLQAYFSGPAFFAWQRMGNIRGWGGPLKDFFILYQYNLQIQILSRMLSFEMYPVLGGFAGHIPYAVKSKYPSINITYSPNWHNFPAKYCCVMLLDFMDPLFDKISSAFYSEQLKYYTLNDSDENIHFYSCDTFNEMNPYSNNTQYLQNASYQIYNAMNMIDNKAVWVMQGTYLIPHKSLPPFWNNITVKAYLSGVTDDELILLDLDTATRPIWYKYNSFFGKKWIWNTLSNFGGNNGMLGMLKNISIGIPNALLYPNTSIYGVGTTMEGMDNNYIIYELTYNMGWNNINQNKFNLNQYITQYAMSRYGLPQSLNNISNSSQKTFVIQNMLESWYMLNETLYEHPILRPPKSKMVTIPKMYDANNYFPYKPKNVQKAWKLFVQIGNALENETKFINDLIDITRQCLSDLFEMNLVNFTKMYNNKNLNGMSIYRDNMMQILNDTNWITSTDINWLLGNWIFMARNLAMNQSISDQDWMEFNARNIISLWGPSGQISNYASKQWNGLIKYYYKPQWNLFFTMVFNAVENNKAFNQNTFENKDMNEIQLPFQTNTSHPFPSKPNLNQTAIDIACALYIKWNMFGDTFCI